MEQINQEVCGMSRMYDGTKGRGTATVGDNNLIGRTPARTAIRTGERDEKDMGRIYAQTEFHKAHKTAERIGNSKDILFVRRARRKETDTSMAGEMP